MASLRKEQNPCKSTQYLNFVSVPSVDVLNLNIANRGLKSVKDQGNRKKRWKFFEWKTFDIRRKKYVRLKLFNFLIKLKKKQFKKTGSMRKLFIPLGNLKIKSSFENRNRSRVFFASFRLIESVIYLTSG